MGADRLRQTIAKDLDVAAIPDDQAPGYLCFGCLQKSVEGTMHYWDPGHGEPGVYHLCGKCAGRGS